METEQKLRVLAKIASKLNTAGIVWDVGASLLLYLHGITDEFHDIDLMVRQEDADDAAEILDRLGTRSVPKAPDPKYHTKRFLEYVIDGVDVDVMIDMIIVKDGNEYDCSLKQEEIDGYAEGFGQRIPLHSVAKWKEYYTLMGRDQKASMIEQADCLLKKRAGRRQRSEIMRSAVRS